MAERLKRLQGRFILSINDVPEIRETFAGFAFHQAELTYSVGGGRGTAARELIITDRNGSAPPNLNTILKALEGDFKGLGTMCAEGRIQTQLICARRCAMTQHCKQQVDRKHV